MAIYQTQAENKIFEIINESVRALGFDIVRIKNLQAGKSKTLQIMIDRMDNENIAIEDCEQVSRHISALLDVEDIIDERYTLEVSSPGLNRPLTRLKDFENNIGNIIKLTIFEAVDGRRRFVGKINEVNEENIVILPKDANEIINLNFNNIEEAFLQYFDSNINSNTK
ncbi:Ribosome maturation factor RimP [Candidatus Jidaibacter acanthamoeba]|uniref:Ribosome maturation factor RimP n=1 Tax=Candidatus Jidaibacter acanthamoebae TaxID=86105 RepID=A0A0C1MSA7_9RICK|nr:ribosome maturation factor RimP [Candidatus Jidaibacter acanthamoeba]KIE04937.1 Ribosome maturation factor RimP [Candidatus Jidaibacter acanthamoeba]